jgi:hypothetical protein
MACRPANGVPPGRVEYETQTRHDAKWKAPGICATKITTASLNVHGPEFT